MSDVSGRTPIYNFDAWAKSHYGTSFDRKQNAKKKYDQKTSDIESHRISVKNELLILVFIFSVVSTYMFCYQENNDVPKIKPTVKKD